MALGPADVYSAQNPGLATVLGSGLGPLRILQQEGYRQYQQHLAAQRLKQQQEAADARTIVPLAANGWLPHNDELSAAVQKGYADMKAKYMDPNATPFERRQFGLQKQAELKAMEDRSNEYRDKYKQTVALGSDKRYNKAALEAGAYNSFFRIDPDTGQRTAVPLQEYDASALDNAATNPAYFNRDEVLKQFIKSQADSESVRLGKAAPPGGYGVSRQASSDIFDVNPDGTLAINADGSYKIRDVNALVQRAHSDPFMAAILRENAAKSQAAAGEQAMLNYGQLSPEQNAALQGLQPAPAAEKADLATMLAPYGKTKSSSVQTFRSAPRPSAGSKPKVVINANANGTPGGIVPIEGNGQGQQYSTSYVFQAPTKTKVSTGQTEAYGYDGAQHGTYIRRVAGKDDEVVTNNREPQNVQYDGGFLALTTPSGKIVRPPGGKELQGQALLDFWRDQRQQNPRLTIEPIVNGSPRKGKNELGDREGIADQLAARYANRPRSEQRKKPTPTRAELLKEADDIVAKQNASYQFIYSDKHPLSEKRRIDSYAPGAFNSKEKQAELQQALQQANEATKPRTTSASTYYSPKPKAATTPRKSNTGGLY